MSEETTQKVPPDAACPKCGKKRLAETESCPRCGLVFSRWNPEGQQVATRLDGHAETLWTQIQSNWSDSGRHEEFLKYCLQADLLPAAGRLYRDRLDENPKDALAAQMQNQVLAKAALSLTLNKSQAPAPMTRSRWFWLVLLLAMALGIAGGLFWRHLR
jgi:rubredoxin